MDMLRALADEEAPWEHVHVFQIDERIAPAGDPDRNLTHLRESLLSHAPLKPEQIHTVLARERPTSLRDRQSRSLNRKRGYNLGA